MTSIDKLLDQYLNGTTTLEEEKTLKAYFAGTSISSTHEVYKPLFVAFSEEQRIKAPKPPFFQTKKKSRTLIRKFWLTTTGVAAIGLLLIMLLPITQARASHCTVIINGKKVSDPKVACEYAKKMFDQADEIVKTSYKPLQSAKKLEKTLDPDAFFKEANRIVSKIKSKKNIHS